MNTTITNTTDSNTIINFSDGSTLSVDDNWYPIKFTFDEDAGNKVELYKEMNVGIDTPNISVVYEEDIPPSYVFSFDPSHTPLERMISLVSYASKEKLTIKGLLEFELGDQIKFDIYPAIKYFVD